MDVVFVKKLPETSPQEVNGIFNRAFPLLTILRVLTSSEQTKTIWNYVDASAAMKNGSGMLNPFPIYHIERECFRVLEE